ASLAVLADTDLTRLTADVAARLQQRGVTFGGEAFVVDPVPRLLAAAEWDALATGLAQRSRALNRFLRDAYGEQQIVESGIISAATIAEAEGFEPDLAGCLPANVAPAAIIGFDVVRDVQGDFLVLEDNLRTPSGIAYALAARDALTHTLPAGLPTPRPIDPITYELLGRVLHSAAPAGNPHPCLVVLTDGPGNVAYYEHAQAASRLDALLVTPADLVPEGDGLAVVLTDGTRRTVDVVYRRTDEDRIRDEHGELTDVARVLLGPWLGGRIGLVNAFGNGLADDKLVHAHVEDFIRFYLDEEPLVRSVPTYALDTLAKRRQAARQLRELVVKPRHGHGGIGVLIGAHADHADLDRVAAELEAGDGAFIAQPIIPLSSHPTVINGRLEPRHVDLRPFAFCADAVELIPGGLTRVALQAGALVVNSSQQGGGKDTWILD
ncbi:MAG: circularly permuted type 2 ATP-grasp protein, partial [Solirubrobacteraceae bacterium]